MIKGKKKAIIVLSLVTILSLGATSAWAMTGQEVIDEVKDRYGNFDSQVVTLTTQCFEGEKQINERKIVLVSQNVGDLTRSVLQFQSPADVKGVGLLDQGDDQMYMYLPEFHKVRRIAGSAKNGSFMGTDFTYNDLSLINYDSSDYQSELIKEDNQFYHLELIDKDQAEADYAKLLMFVRKNDFFPTRVEFYAKDTGKLKKVLTAYDLTDYGKYKLPQKLVMEDLTTQHKTVIYLTDPEFDRQLDKDTFSERNLRRSRLRY